MIGYIYIYIKNSYRMVEAKTIFEKKTTKKNLNNWSVTAGKKILPDFMCGGIN